MYGGEFDGNALFSGGGFMPSQATQSAEPGQSSSRTRGAQTLFPLTVKQISAATQANDDKSSFSLDGAEVTNVRLLGLVQNKLERVTDVAFNLDDGTGKIDVTRWVNDASDTSEMAKIQNGMYVKVSGHLKGFHGRMQVTAFSIRPVTDFNEVTLHFIECIHVHLINTKKAKISDNAPVFTNTMMTNSFQNGTSGGYQSPLSKIPGVSAGGPDDINQKVLSVFEENLAVENGIHVDAVVQRLRLPAQKINAVINYLVNEGVIYSTIDEYHFKATTNG